MNLKLNTQPILFRIEAKKIDCEVVYKITDAFPACCRIGNYDMNMNIKYEDLRM